LEYQTFRLFVGELEHEISGESGLIALALLGGVTNRAQSCSLARALDQRVHGAPPKSL